MQTHDYKKLIKMNSNLSERLVSGLIYDPMRKDLSNDMDKAVGNEKHLPNKTDSSEVKIDTEQTATNIVTTPL